MAAELNAADAISLRARPPGRSEWDARNGDKGAEQASALRPAPGGRAGAVDY